MQYTKTYKNKKKEVTRGKRRRLLAATGSPALDVASKDRNRPSRPFDFESIDERASASASERLEEEDETAKMKKMQASSE